MEEGKGCQIFNEYDKVQNFDDVFYRSVIIGMLSELMDGIWFNQVVGGKIEKKHVPIYYSMTGDETWLKENFLDQYQECFCPDKSYMVEGNIDSVPRGILKLESVSLDSGQLTTTTTMGTFQQRIEEEDGYRYETFASMMRLLPQTLSFTLTIRYDTVVQGMRLMQAIYREFYKQRKFYIQFEGQALPCNMGLQEDFEKESRFEFEYPNSEQLEMSISFEVESYLPVIDPTEVRHASNRLQNGIEVRLEIDNPQVQPVSDPTNPTKTNPIDPINTEIDRKRGDENQTKGDLHSPYGYDLDGDKQVFRPSVRFKGSRNR